LARLCIATFTVSNGCATTVYAAPATTPQDKSTAHPGGVVGVFFFVSSPGSRDADADAAVAVSPEPTRNSSCLPVIAIDSQIVSSYKHVAGGRYHRATTEPYQTSGKVPWH
jgi:hypothetical protein